MIGFMNEYNVLTERSHKPKKEQYYEYLKTCDHLSLPPLSSGILRNRVLDKNIDVSGYNLGDRYVEALANGLYFSSGQAKFISLSRNRLTDKSCIQFLEYNLGKSLQSLDLSYNPNLSQNTYKLLSIILFERKYIPLRSLNLEGNKMRNPTMIVEALQYNTNLTFLNLNRNDIGDQYTGEIKEMLVENEYLGVLFLGWN